MFAFNPSLKNSTNKKNFENTFIEYIKVNLVLKNKKGKTLNYHTYQELKNNGHSHQNNYLIIFKGSDLFEITNTILFNVYDNQVNYNTITMNTKQETFKTKQGITSFALERNENTRSWYLLTIFLTIIYFAYQYIKRKTPANKKYV